MYPTLLTLGSLRIDTYSVVWFIALALAITWSIRRLPLYNLNEDDSRRIMAISFLFMLLGARSYEYIAHWKTYLNNPSLFLNLNRGGLHEFGALLGAFISALVLCLCSKGKISFLKLCDVAIIPFFLAIAIGRWGCFLNGCCVGRRTDFCLAVHFPRDSAGVFRHPVQLYYSAISAAIIFILLWAERKLRQQEHYYSIIAPLGLALYSLMRITMSFVRETRPFSWLSGHSWTYKGIVFMLPLICLWLAYSLLRLKAAKRSMNISQGEAKISRHKN